MKKRYTAAYSVASTTIGIGRFISIGSLVVGTLFAVLLFVTSSGNATALSIGWCLLSLLTGVIVGTVIMALGQMMQAMLDIAVNTSPLMDAVLKADILKVRINSSRSDDGVRTVELLTD
jgi:hypothetical protein